MTDPVTMETLRTDLATVMRDAEALLKASTEQGGAKAEEARARIRESLQGAKARLLEAERTAVRHGEEAVAATEARIRDNPWQSVGFAAAVGLAIGVLLARR
jgi:ElaB/YqjD/DUF883 family membrane-anchored ribosome-binding protein